MFIDNPLIDALLRGALLAILALGWMNLLIRVNGLRTLSKMTNFDFVTTVAFGSLLAGAGQASDLASLLQALAAMGGLVLGQAIASTLRKRFDMVDAVVGNEPRLLMWEGDFRDDALKESDVRREDMIAKLREANVLQMSEVRAAVLETTGDISVLHGSEDIDATLLRDVRGAAPGS